jgi:2'-5' RNA ligase
MPSHPSFTRYFLGIAIPEPENALLAEVRRRYHPEHRLTSPPHITLKPPFQMPNRRYLQEKLAKVARYTDPFSVSFELIGSWRQPKYGTVFLEARQSEKLKQLERSLSANIAFLPANPNFHPHLTLAQRVPHEQLMNTKKELRALGLALTVSVSAITLFQQNDSGWWEIDQQFPFGLSNAHTPRTKSDGDGQSANLDMSRES